MYAIIETGGKQYRVEKGMEIDVELLGDEKNVEFKSVLFGTDGKKTEIGTPHIAGWTVKSRLVQI